MFGRLSTLIICIVYVHIEGICGDSTVNLASIAPILEEEKNILEIFDPESFFGVLYSQDEFERWTDKEEEMMEVLEKRLELVDEEIDLIAEYLEDYDESTGEAMRHLREPKTPPEERGKIVGSSAILGHRMTSRYAGVIAQIRTLLTSDDYLENEENLARVLEEPDELDEFINTPKKAVPASQDLFQLMDYFFHVQHAYGYGPSQLMSGLNSNNATNREPLIVSALQCVEIGMFAVFRREYHIAVEWLEVASQLLVFGEDDEDFGLPLNMAFALSRLAIQQHNRAFQVREEEETTSNFYASPITPDGIKIPVLS